jgi:dTDP-4-dehydrorhamnose reductase
MRVLVLGSTGMLGSGVTRILGNDEYFDVTATNRETAGMVLDINCENIPFDALVDGDLEHWRELHGLNSFDYIINCIGCIKPFINDSQFLASYVNGSFPHRLSEWAKKCDSKVIHITTDCVFSGKSGQYTEESLHDEWDFYGMSKTLGEPTNCMVIRTSIIGQEHHKHASLIAWVESNAGNTIDGYLNHHWNGITTTQYGEVVSQIMKDGLYEEDLYHVHSPTSVSKYELVGMINKRYDLGITINPVAASTGVDRTLATVKDLNAKLNIPELEYQLASH